MFLKQIKGMVVFFFLIIHSFMPFSSALSDSMGVNIVFGKTQSKKKQQNNLFFVSLSSWACRIQRCAEK